MNWAFPQMEARSASGKVDADVVFVAQDVSKKPVISGHGSAKSPYASTLEKLKAADGFTARSGSTQIVRFGGQGQADTVVFVGLGQPSELTDDKVRQAGAALWARLGSEKLVSVALHVSDLKQVSHLRALLEGMVLSCYNFSKYKKAPDPMHATRKVVLVAPDRATASRATAEIERALAVGECVNITRDWSNEPSNLGTPEYFALEAQKLARKHGLKCRVMSEAEARREKMGLFLAVGQGSEREGKIVVLEYNPKKSGSNRSSKPRTLAFVGKGITFDSGGISIKPSLKMEEMKHDMTGAATLFGATLLAAKLGAPNRIVTILAFTENMPDGSATQPGNVVHGRNGKSVEIVNTDAEGRLILADVLDYAHEFKPDAIVDAATLTGAVQVALGKHCCAVLGNDDGLIQALISAGADNHERIWQLPMWDEYFEDLKTDCADMRNVANDSSGGTIRGAIFMAQFIRKGMKWAHLDIAAVANGMGHVPYFPKKGASGIYVRTLAQFAADF
ncbi:MAG: leucyl aminopeptidase [Oligoflexia bacterium]